MQPKNSTNLLKDMNREHETEMINIWHLSRIISLSRHERMVYTQKHTHEKFPQYSKMCIYKNLDRIISNGIY